MKIGVIMGGTSSEREISLSSGKEIAKNLDKNKYDIVPLVIDSKEEVIQAVSKVDFAFIALHGKFGEDGTLQGMLETMNIPYSGCGVLSSSMCMDKDVTKKLVSFAGVNTAEWITLKETTTIDYKVIEKIGYPLVVKPNNGGSSVGTYIAKSDYELDRYIKDALKYDDEIMIEKYIDGEEITCCILDGELLPILVIKPKSTFFDFYSKYSDGGAEEHVIQLEHKLFNKIKSMALKCYEVLKCDVYARVDMIIKDREPYLLEVNTLPGMTKNSLFPKSANAANISFVKLLDIIIEKSIKIKR